MVHSPRCSGLRGCACLAGLLACWAAALPAQPPKPPKESPLPVSAPPDAKGDKPMPPRLEDIKLPADAILLVCQQTADALRAFPKFYLVPLEEYAARSAEMKRLRQQLQAKQPAAFDSLRLTGKVRDGLVELKASYKFTPGKQTTVALGCRPGHPIAVQLDGKLPPVGFGSDGLVLEVGGDRDQQHEATLDMQLVTRPLTPAPEAVRPATDGLEGFELQRPAAGLAYLELDLPNGARAVEVNDQPVQLPLRLNGSHLEGPLSHKAGPLKIAWRLAVGPGTPVALASVQGRITVRLRQGQATADAELTLQDLGRSVKEWHLQLPAHAQVRLANKGDEVLLQGTIKGNGSREGSVRIPLKHRSTAPLVVVVSAPLRRVEGTLRLGPFAVPGAARQSGTIWIVGEPDQRVRCLPSREPAKGPSPFEAIPHKPTLQGGDRPPPGAVAAFQYWGSPGGDKVAPADPWFKLDVESIKGVLDTRLLHTLRLLPPVSAGGPPGWRLATTVEAVPVRAGVEELKVEWPAPWQFDQARGPRPAGAVSAFKEGAGGQVTHFELAAKSLKPFTLELEAHPGAPTRSEPFPPVPGLRSSSAVVRLPHPLDTRDRGGHLITLLVPDDLDVRVPQPSAENARLELVSQETHKVVWRADRFPERVAVAWKPYRPDLRVDSVADVTVTASFVAVRHRLRFTFAAGERVPAAVLLHVPKEVTEQPVVEGGELSRDAPTAAVRPGSQTFRCVLQRPSAEAKEDRGRRQAEIVLEYHAAAAQGKDVGQRLLPVPLVAPAQATQGTVKVRVWGEPGSRFRALRGAWEDDRLEVVPSRSSLPALVLRGLRPALPLTLDWQPAQPREETTAVLADRALIQVRVTEGGFQHYRVRFLLRQVGTDHLDLALPAALAALDLHVTLAGKAVDLRPVEGSRAGANVARLLPLGTGPAVLDVTYQLVPGRTADGGALRTVLQPVTIPGLLAGVPTRWQVDLPPSWVPLSLEGGSAAAWQWGRRGWLLAPRPAATRGDLEQWFRADTAAGTPLPDAEAAEVPSFVCWRGGPAALTLSHAPQQGWLLVCSLGVLVLGLALYFLPLGPQRGDASPNRLFWPLLALVGLAVAGLGLVWPGLLAAVLYGSQPGLAILVLVLGIQWLLHERYRRRVVFLPGFRRVKTGSSLTRAGSSGALAAAGSAEGERPASGSPGGRSSAAPRPRSEPSTVDEPPPPANV